MYVTLQGAAKKPGQLANFMLLERPGQRRMLAPPRLGFRAQRAKQREAARVRRGPYLRTSVAGAGTLKEKTIRAAGRAVVSCWQASFPPRQ